MNSGSPSDGAGMWGCLSQKHEAAAAEIRPLQHRNCHSGLDQGLIAVPSLRCFKGQHKIVLKWTLGSTVLVTVFNYGEYFCCLRKSPLDFFAFPRALPLKQVLKTRAVSFQFLRSHLCSAHRNSEDFASALCVSPVSGKLCACVGHFYTWSFFNWVLSGSYILKWGH